MIGVYDSGIGCVTVLSHLLKELPQEDFFCLADYQNCPYGEKTKEELEEIIMKNIQLLIDKKCKMIVIACNTASTFAATLRKKFQVPIIAIEPAIKMVNDFHPQEETLVLATPFTIQSEKFQHLMENFGNLKTHLIACPHLANLIEQENLSAIQEYLKQLLLPYREVKNIVLGCTHYPLIREEIRKILPNSSFYDGGLGVAKQTKRVLQEKGLETKKGSARITFYFTDGISREQKFLETLHTYMKQENMIK